MIGARSIVYNFEVANNKNPQSPYKVQIQANRNFGFCDIILPGNPVAPEKISSNLKKDDKKQEKESYEVKKAEYDAEVSKRKAIRNLIFNRFQGRQLNDEIVVESLRNALSIVLNAAEL